MLEQESVLVCVARGNPKGYMQQDVGHVMACSVVAEIWSLCLENRQVAGGDQGKMQCSIKRFQWQKNETSIAVMQKYLFDRWQILDCPTQHMTSLILSIRLWAQQRGQLAGVWSTEMQQEKYQLQLWQLFFIQGRFAEQAVLQEKAFFIAKVSYQSFLLSILSGYFLSWSGGLIRWPFSLYSSSQGMDHTSVGNTGLTHFKM